MSFAKSHFIKAHSRTLLAAVCLAAVFLKATQVTGCTQSAVVKDNARPTQAQTIQADALEKIDFEALRSQMPQLVAWLRSPGTKLDYPVMQAQDNTYYLSHLPNGDESILGAVFLDYRLQADFSAPNAVLYAHHNWQSSEMFGILENYKNPEYYRQHPTMQLYTPSGSYEIALIGAYAAKASDAQVPVQFTAGEQQRYLNQVRKKSYFQSQVQLQPGDRLITLCTCTYQPKNARLVVVGRLRRV